MIKYPYVGEVVRWSAAYIAPHPTADWPGLEAARLEVIETGKKGICNFDVLAVVRDLETQAEIDVNPADLEETNP